MSENQRIILRLLKKYIFRCGATVAVGSAIGVGLGFICSISPICAIALVFMACIACVIYSEYKFYQKWGKFLDE